ncbi:888_t:CDS:1, partial [Cetraspora pellucida]
KQNVRQYNRKANPYWCITTGKICLTTTVSAKGSPSIAMQRE